MNNLKNEIEDCFRDIEDSRFEVKTNFYHNTYKVEIEKMNIYKIFPISDIFETILFTESYLKSEFNLKLFKINIKHAITSKYKNVEFQKFDISFDQFLKAIDVDFNINTIFKPKITKISLYFN